MSHVSGRERQLQGRLRRVMEQWQGTGERQAARGLLSRWLQRLGWLKQKRGGMILGRRLEYRGGSWELFFDVQTDEDGRTQQAVVRKGSYADADQARREMARFPVGSTYRP